MDDVIIAKVGIEKYSFNKLAHDQIRSIIYAEWNINTNGKKTDCSCRHSLFLLIVYFCSGWLFNTALT